MTVVVGKRRPLPEHPLFDFITEDRNRANPSGAAVQHRQPPPQFPGPSYVQELDQIRLSRLQFAVFQLMRDCQWRTHSEMKAAIGFGSETGIAAMLRGLRHKENGKHFIDKRRRGNPEDGLFEYQLIVNPRTRIELKAGK